MPERVNFIARKQSYHGNTLGALSVSGHLSRRKPYEEILCHNVFHVSACNSYRGRSPSETDEEYVRRLAEELEEAFARAGGSTVCAFVAEPVVGAALGAVPAVPGYFKAMKAVCDRHGALMIMDEIMCGMGRTGTVHAWQQEDVIPDIQTIGKGLGGGYVPMAGLLIAPRVVWALNNGSGTFVHGQTYQSHAVVCAGAHEVQRIIRDQKLVENVAALGSQLGDLLREYVGALPYVGDVRGRGFFWGIEFVKNKQTKTPFESKHQVAELVHQVGLRQKPNAIMLYPGTGSAGGSLGDHVIVSPPYNCTVDEIRLIVEATTAAVISAFDHLDEYVFAEPNGGLDGQTTR